MRSEKYLKLIKNNRNKILMIGAITLFIVALGCIGTTQNKQNTDIKFPDYVYTDALALNAYTYATKHPDVLEQIPCYCGCGGHSGHRFLRDCFIKDDWSYDEHARYCDVCIGETMKVQSYLAEGKTLKEARALIDKEYGARYPTGKSNTPEVSDNYKPILTGKLAASPTTASIPVTTATLPDLSSLSLPQNFRSMSDGLKFIPAGISWAYFVNLKQGTGIETGKTEETDFYGSQIIGMLNSEYPDGSFVELHDIGKNLTGVKSNAGNYADNILYTRPFIYSTKDRTDSVLALFREPGNATAYNQYRSILDKVDDENAGFAKINTSAPSFADASYIGLVKSGNDVKGEIAFSIKDGQAAPLATYNELKNSSSGRGFRSYDVLMENKTLIIRMTSNLNSVISEARQNYGIEI
ncbi:Protein of uncharacterised function with PCYCGC motif protein [uncultured archaeon]|nr:Protein of uncharacterised function with PCYCGC motif protein [uncultured archaeon]